MKKNEAVVKNIPDLTSIKVKSYMIEELSKLTEGLVSDIKGLYTEWRRVGEEQKKTWNSETDQYELVWEDEEKTIPKMCAKYDDVEIPEEEMSEDTKLKLRAYRELFEKLESLI